MLLTYGFLSKGTCIGDVENSPVGVAQLGETWEDVNRFTQPAVACDIDRPCVTVQRQRRTSRSCFGHHWHERRR